MRGGLKLRVDKGNGESLNFVRKHIFFKKGEFSHNQENNNKIQMNCTILNRLSNQFKYHVSNNSLHFVLISTCCVFKISHCDNDLVIFYLEKKF